MKFLTAVLMLSGMIIGVGVFGVPFSFARAGFLLGSLELFLLAGVVTAVHLSYAEVVLKTNARHRLPGYSAFHLGPYASYLSWGSAFFGISGTLLAYILLGSRFLSLLLSRLFPDTRDAVWAVLFVSACALITLFPLRKEAFINGVLTALLIGFFLFLSGRLLLLADPARFLGFSPSQALFPYGVILFALSGALVIPDLITFLGKNSVHARLAIVIGSLIPAFITLLFAAAVVGVSGPGTSEDAIQGLRAAVGDEGIVLGSIIGFLAVFTSYLVLTSSFQALLTLDFGMKEKTAWLAGIGIPFAAYALGVTDFIRVIAAVGAVAIGIDSGLILAMQGVIEKRKRRRSFMMRAGKAAIYAMIVIGIVYEIAKIIANP